MTAPPHVHPSVFIDPTLPLDRISPDAIIHPGCRILGPDTSIGPGCILGKEAPLTLENCQLQSNVSLAGGFCSGSSFLTGASLGADAHLRPGTILEEHAGGGHAVGLKQTILMPFVTTGSLINVCDCLMAGGTDRKNHSEIGSSYVHFNYTPNQDKATASLLGDVPRGVMLDQAPIFLGGQGGLVGPARIAYGTVIAAGTIWRGDILEPNQLHYGKARHGSQASASGVYKNARRIVRNNLIYIGNLHALLQWYEHVRARFMQHTPFDTAAFRGARARITLVIGERLKRMDELVEKLAASSARHPSPDEAAFQNSFAATWPALRPHLTPDATANIGARDRVTLLAGLDTSSKRSYLDAIHTLSPSARTSGTAWLQAVVDAVANHISC